jgi:hypothetical protein
MILQQRSAFVEAFSGGSQPVRVHRARQVAESRKLTAAKEQ